LGFYYERVKWLPLYFVIVTKKTNDTLWFTICLNALANFEEKLTLNDVVVEDETIQT
jgi:hypothetical protein